MKQRAAFLMLAVFLFSAGGSLEQKKEAETYLEEVVQLYQKHFEDTAAIAALLSEAIAAHPDHIGLLNSRASLYCNRGMRAECRADTTRIVELAPENIEARSMLCILDDFEGVDRQTVAACYLDIAERYAAQPPADSPEREMYRRFNHVFMLLMAGHPDAEKEKEAFLLKVDSSPDAWMYHGVLDDFDRDMFLHKLPDD